MYHRIAGLAVATLMVSTAIAQTPSTTPISKAPTATTVPSKSTKVPVVRTAKSLNCSKQADSKGLHGKPRKGFLSSCKKA